MFDEDMFIEFRWKLVHVNDGEELERWAQKKDTAHPPLRVEHDRLHVNLPTYILLHINTDYVVFYNFIYSVKHSMIPSYDLIPIW